MATTHDTPTLPPPPVVRYRNRTITERDLEEIRATIAGDPSLTRQELSRRLCELWEWRQPNGALREYACRDLLLRLEEWGHLTLPARRPWGRRRAGDEPRRRRLPLLPFEEIPIVREEITADDLDSLEVRPITPEERLGWRVYMARFHYLGDVPIVGEHLLYAAFAGAKLAALLGWASAALRSPLRERYIGWDEGRKREGLSLIAQNVRFLILPWVRVAHLGSKALSQNLRRLSSDWQQRYHHPILLAETFVDTARFRGTVYRAANWIYLGQSAGRTKRGNRYLHEGSPKALYVYPVLRDACRRLREGRRS
jgi:hypothetical protein